jgi:hypothetical protein
MPMEGSAFARVNFTDGAPVGEDYAGYVQDFGDVFDLRNGLEYGWTEDNTATARDRDDNDGPLPYDERYDSLNHLQNPSPVDRVWEIAVPNGTYFVRVVGGDINNVDHNIGFNVEGELTGLVPIRTVVGDPSGDDSLIQDRFVEFYVVVEVTDGKLTIRTDTTSPKPEPDANTSNNGNNKIVFVDINQVGVPPTGINLTGTAGNDNWYLKRSGDQVQVFNNADGSGTPASTHALGSNFSLAGGAGDDTVTIDLSGGDIGLGSFTIQGDAGTDQVRLVNADDGTLTLASAPTLNGHTLDLATGDLLVTGGNLAAIEAMVAGGSIATSAGTDFIGLAPIQQNGNVLVKYSYNGDVNGDGLINIDDYVEIDTAFLSQPANPVYAQGDFNFDERIDIDDYVMIDSAFLNQGAPLAASASPVSATSGGSPAAAVVAVADAEQEKKTVRKSGSSDSLFSSRRIERRAGRRGR